MRYNIPDRVLREITFLSRKHNIEKVVLFGSRARGDHAPRSDIDIAVSGGDFDDFYWDVKENIHSLLMFDVVDLSGKVSEELRNEIEKDGIELYAKNIQFYKLS